VYDAFCLAHHLVIAFGGCCVHVSGQRKLSTERRSPKLVMKLETLGDAVAMPSPGL